ncbi:MAG: helix-turn-helix transcriptional regulator [Lachnospiraceae bacterium]|nr:helix-turn-helix transcriptional regulator [Lachnospiraceae bacterium]
MNLGEQILFLRKNKQITQEQLARELGVTNQAVSKWESGQCMPDIQLLPEIARFFKVSIDELMGVSTAECEDDLLVRIKNKLDAAKPGTEYAEIMKIVKALHAIAWVKESERENSGMPKLDMDETIEHAVDTEWGYSSVSVPKFTATMRRDCVFFAGGERMFLDDADVTKISKLLKTVADRWALSVLFSIYDKTYKSDDEFARYEDISEDTDIEIGQVKSIVAGNLSKLISENDDKTGVRIKGEYMNIPPILSVLRPGI